MGISITVQREPKAPKVGRRRRIIFVALVALGLAVPTAAYASHQFNDVADSNPFHDDIDALADAGITAGFGDGGFHPTAAVSRQSMAAFLHRALPRVSESNVVLASSVSDTDGAVTIGDVRLKTPESSATGTQFVELTATVVLDPFTLPTECGTSGCSLTFSWIDVDTVCFPACFPIPFPVNTLEVFYGSDDGPRTMTVMAMVPEPMNNDGTYSLQMTVNTPDVSDAYFVDGIVLRASTAAYGWDGTSTWNEPGATEAAAARRVDKAAAETAVG